MNIYDTNIQIRLLLLLMAITEYKPHTFLGRQSVLSFESTTWGFPKIRGTSLGTYNTDWNAYYKEYSSLRSEYGNHCIFLRASVEVRRDLGEDDDKLIGAHSTVPHIGVPVGYPKWDIHFGSYPCADLVT